MERLLDAHRRVGTFLEHPAASSLAGNALKPGTQVGNYRIVRFLGAGGGGTIYEAEQTSPNRRVALKVMAGGLPSATARRRFREEAELLARLQHPGIATVFDAGVHDGVPYFALEYVEGARTITRHAREEELDRNARLALFARVCDAVHHGHQKGVIHRDLKPGNVLVDAGGNPRVIDFGIARPAGRGIRSGELAGTLPYMSPEQCEVDADLDVRCDVYALGVVLFELLMGRLPHDLDGIPFPEAVRRIREGEIQEIDRGAGRDVAAILRKALARRRSARYASASALADDVRRLLDNRAVEARDAGPAYQLGKLARRHRGAVGAAAAFVALLVAAVIVAGSLAVEKESQRRAASFQAYVANISAASAALRVHDVAEARQRLELAPAALRNWEWHHLHGRLDASSHTRVFPNRRIYTGDASPDGALAAAAAEGRLWAWERVGDTLWDTPVPDRVDALAFDPSSRRLAAGYRDGRVELRGARNGALVWTIDTGNHVINAVAFSPDGARLATAGRDGVVRLWSTDGGEAAGTLAGHRDRLIDVCFDATGTRLATASRDGTARLWDLASGRPIVTCVGHRGSVESVALNAAGTLLATCSRDRSVRLWDATNGRLLESWHGHAGNVRTIAFAPDGDTLVSASYDSTLRLWRRPVGEVSCLHGHVSPIMSLAATGGRVISFARDGTVKTWNLDGADPVQAARGHLDAIAALAYAPDGRWLASASRDGAVLVWDTTLRKQPTKLDAGAHPSALLFLKPDTLWTLTTPGVLRSWSVPDGRLRWERHDQPRLAVGTNGRIFGYGRKLLRLAGDGERWEELATVERVVDALAFDRSRRRLAIGTREGAIHLHDGVTGTRVASAAPHTNRVMGLAFDPEFHLLASCSDDGTIALLDADTLAVRQIFAGLSSRVTCVAFSPDGTRLATSGADRHVRLWDVAEATHVATLTGHHNEVPCLAWSPDGRTLASGGGNVEVPGVIRFWDASR
ncbi:MAG: WD40 repeat domain-containing serine/threonine protein kinase [Planctomycetota bacterium]